VGVVSLYNLGQPLHQTFNGFKLVPNGWDLFEPFAYVFPATSAISLTWNRLLQKASLAGEAMFLAALKQWSSEQAFPYFASTPGLIEIRSPIDDRGVVRSSSHKANMNGATHAPSQWPVASQREFSRTLAVVPVYGQHHLTDALLQDCRREAVPVVVIDNGGDYEETGNETVLRPKGNVGWLAASNLGIEWGVTQACYDRFVLLNNDLRLSHDFFAGLIWTEKTSGASIIGASYDGWWKVQRPEEARNGSAVPADQYRPRPEYLPYGSCDGTCLSVHRRVIEEVGLLDHDAFGRYGWAATTDLCFRAREKSLTTAITRAAFANHLDGGRHTAKIVFGTSYESSAEAEGSLGMSQKWGPNWRESRPIPTAAPCIVYTAITGQRDTLKEPMFVPPGWRFVCFSDDTNLQSPIWEIWPLAWTSPDGDPRRTARWHKINTHKLFSDDPISIWTDASVRVTTDWRGLLWHLGSFGMTSYKHYQRDCLYAEAQECIRLGLDEPNLILQQVTGYRKDGYPEHNGLLETTILLRRHLVPEMVRFAELWWGELSRGSKRDQISVNYVAWRLGLQYGIVQDTLRSSAWFVRHRDRLPSP
jgi:GT2 family glycosyltransferase